MTFDPNQERDEHGRWSAAALGGHIERALAESPGRLTHGHTATNAFIVTQDGKIIPHNQVREKYPNSVSVHSHLADNVSGGAIDVTKHVNTFSGGDVYSLAKSAPRFGMTTYAVLTTPNHMDTLAVRPDTNPAFFRLGTKSISNQLEPDYATRSAWWDSNKGRTDLGHLQHPSEEVFRERMRDFAKKYRLDYSEHVPFRANPQTVRPRVKKL